MAGVASSPSIMASNMPSLEMKPNSGGTAAMDVAAMSAMLNVHGMTRQIGPSRRISRVPVWWPTTPISMNKLDLNNACASVCTTAATMASGVPIPMVHTIQPS